MKSNGEYDWSLSIIGGTTRVNLSKGEDIMHLDELDQKYWTVMSCPVKGLEMDGRTLAILDSDADGHIHVKDILRTVKWLRPIIKDPDSLMRGDSFIPLYAFNEETPEGKMLLSSAHHVLDVLGLDQEFVSVENVADPAAIFKNTAFNGDGTVTPLSTEDEALRQTMRDIIAAEGPAEDRSGEEGVNAETVEKFFTALKEFSEWKEAGDAAKGNIFPFGEDTEAAWSACSAIKEKMDDFFLRCSLASFDGGTLESLDTSKEKIGTICDRNLSDCKDEIAACPLAKVNPAGELSLTEGINPVWKEALDSFRSIVLKSYKGKTINEAQWKKILNIFAPYAEWMASRKGEEVAFLGYDRVKELLAGDHFIKLTNLITKDLEYTEESENIGQLSDLLFIYRDFFRVLNNFVTFKEFYSSEESGAVFRAGTLFIDQRSCQLCIPVFDVAGHSQMSPLSEMFLLYCDCKSKLTSEKMTIVAAVTDGDIANLREGKNGVFYDNKGNDWDATVIKIIDNPISIRQAFWTPYRRLGNFINESLAKFAAEKETEVVDRGKDDISTVAETAVAKEPKEPKQTFDVAKFAGLFAMIGMALGTILGFALDLFKGFASLTPLRMTFAILAVLIVISGPSMLRAYFKLRKRNITPLLNANGWAINSKMLVNMVFGRKLTSMAKYPVVAVPKELKKKGGIPWYVTVLIILVGILGIVLGIILI